MDDDPHFPDELTRLGLTRRSVLAGGFSTIALAYLLTGATPPQRASATTVVQYRLPFPTSSITQEFGHDGHRGTDFGSPPALAGVAIPAVAAGHVSGRGVATASSAIVYNYNYGNWVRIDHADGKSSFYAHMQSPSGLDVGDTVSRGHTVGLIGRTGGTVAEPVTGNHLHLGLTPTGTSNFQDPISYILAHLDPPLPPPLIGENEMIFLKTTSPEAWYLLEEFNFTQFASQADAENFGNILPDSITITSSNIAFLKAHAEHNRSTLIADIAAAVTA